jgi:hypothetical protein
VIVDQQSFGVIERRRRMPDAATAFEHLPEQRRRRPMHERQVISLRQEDVDLDAAQDRHVHR